MISFSFGKINKCSRFKAYNWEEFTEVSFGNQLSLSIVRCQKEVELQFVIIPGKVFKIKEYAEYIGHFFLEFSYKKFQ